MEPVPILPCAFQTRRCEARSLAIMANREPGAPQQEIVDRLRLVQVHLSPLAGAAVATQR